MVDKRGEAKGLLKDVLTGIIDFTVSRIYIRGFWNVQTYPFYTGSFNIVSLKEPIGFFYISRQLLTLKVWFLFIASSVVSIILLKYILEQSIFLAALEFTRMLVSASTLKQPRKLYGKILLITLVIACFAISTFLLSYLDAIITVADRSSAIDSAEDLINSNLSVYGFKSHKELILYDEIRDRFLEITTFKECVDRLLLEGDRISCIAEGYFLRWFVYENATIHISKDNLASRAFAYTFSHDSPFRLKFTWTLLNYLNRVEQRVS